MLPSRPAAASPMRSLLPLETKSSGSNRRGPHSNLKSMSIVPNSMAARAPVNQSRHATIAPMAKSTEKTFMTRLKDDATSELRPPSPFDEGSVDDPPTAVVVSDNYFGNDALHRFWSMFQSHDSTFRSKRLRPRSARTTYLTRLRRLAKYPEPLGVIRKCESPRVDLHDYEIGNDLAAAMGESLALIPGIESLNLASNRISDDAASDVIAHMGTSTTLGGLDFSNNQLNLHAATSLAAMLGHSKTLVHLSLEHNKLNSAAITMLCDALKKNQTVRRLNLSENQFDTAGMFALASLLAENATIEELYLSWNKIRGLGGQRIVESIGYHSSLRVLDLSWNSLNSCTNHAIATALAAALANNNVLAHLDLSNNSLDTRACAILAAALVTNHTIIGLHMVGNQSKVDARGFVLPLAAPIAVQAQHKFCSIKHFELQQDPDSNATTLDAYWAYVDRACWLCGRWSEHRFVWTPSHKLDVKVKAKLHLSIDEWSGDDMNRSNDMFVLYRMLPPGKTKYFITVETEGTTPGDVKKQYVVLKDKRTARLLRVHGDDHLFGTLQYVNYIAMTRYDGTNPCHATLPRPGANTIKALKWDIKKSVFASRYKESPSKAPVRICRVGGLWYDVAHAQIDTDALVAKAFAVDFKHCKIDRIVRDAARKKDLEAAGALHFKAIANLFRKYCSRGLRVALDQVSISWSGFSEFVDDCHLIDEASERCRASDMDNVFVAANLEVTEEAKQQDNPDRSLTRFEFLECVVRIALNKYCNSKPVECDSPAQALHRLMEEHLAAVVPDDPNDFRMNYLYKEEVSDCFLEYVVLLKDVFAANSGKYCRIGEPKGMSIHEFAALMETYHVLDDTFKQRDLREPFFASKLMMLDEMAPPESTKKLLFFNDFLEMLLRVALLRIPPATPSVTDATASLQLFITRYICGKDKLVAVFQHSADKVRVIGALSKMHPHTPPTPQMERRGSRKQLARKLSRPGFESNNQEGEDGDVRVVGGGSRRPSVSYA
ncbi:Aste57867_10319 [Aphanomyces stellatus]|uniref:Aste57867_10319 protein n=1 Tax=Aphanomyces stellatus TaxID=120398 RepID=A0A485KQK2_9STRA|nr:hypothetical protein As57867_010279 [Aphanomyces stellatus]VFT87193.1 Aste57867_10319 [Aphanomyces stellatus]